jgi:hypothetical protein
MPHECGSYGVAAGSIYGTLTSLVCQQCGCRTGGEQECHHLSMPLCTRFMQRRLPIPILQRRIRATRKPE